MRGGGEAVLQGEDGFGEETSVEGVEGPLAGEGEKDAVLTQDHEARALVAHRLSKCLGA